MLNRTEVANAIQAVLNKNYNLVSDPTATNKLDHNDNVDQDFTVMFSKLPDASYTSVPVDEAGNPIPGTTPTAETGEPGTPVKTPTVLGYTPSKTLPEVPTDNGDVKVVYSPDVQKGTVHFVDEAGGTLAPDIEVTGVTNGLIDHTKLSNQIQQIINHNYNLVSDDTAVVVFNNDDNDNQNFTISFSKLPDAGYTSVPVDEAGNPIPGTTPT
ncbi:hypothetical protein GM612_12170, partial [Lactobacillus sp. CRM56-3]|nr:hypothetical protein [Secundilactobacillus folii]